MRQFFVTYSASTSSKYSKWRQVRASPCCDSPFVQVSLWHYLTGAPFNSQALSLRIGNFIVVLWWSVTVWKVHHDWNLGISSSLRSVACMDLPTSLFGQSLGKDVAKRQVKSRLYFSKEQAKPRRIWVKCPVSWRIRWGMVWVHPPLSVVDLGSLELPLSSKSSSRPGSTPVSWKIWKVKKPPPCIWVTLLGGSWFPLPLPLRWVFGLSCWYCIDIRVGKAWCSGLPTLFPCHVPANFSITASSLNTFSCVSLS